MEHLVVQAVGLGAYEVIQKAMQTHRDSADVSEWATHALRLMSRLATQRPYARHRWQPQQPLQPREDESSASLSDWAQ